MSPVAADCHRKGGDIMSVLLTVVPSSNAVPHAGPVHRSIVVVDIEGSTKRTNPERGELRRILYHLLDQALYATGIGPGHLEPMADRGDGVLIMIKPHDGVPKTILLSLLIPALAALLDEHNTTVAQPALRLRLRVVVHAGEVDDDGRGFYGEDLDVAFRLLNAPRVKRALRETPTAPLVLVVSEEIFAGVVRHRYIDGGRYEPLVRVRVAERQRRGWIHIPAPASPDHMVALRRPRWLPPVRPVGSEAPRALAVISEAPRPVAVISEAPRPVSLSTVYQALERRLAETEEPYDVKAGLAELKKWMSAR